LFKLKIRKINKILPIFIFSQIIFIDNLTLIKDQKTFKDKKFY
jgi:hypothetical protein